MCRLVMQVGGDVEHLFDDGETLFLVRCKEGCWGEILGDERQFPREVVLESDLVVTWVLVSVWSAAGLWGNELRPTAS